MSRKRKSKKRPIGTASNKEKTALDALKEVKKLQNSSKPKAIEAVTQAAPGKVGKSMGSNDLSQEDPTGGSLQWYEKFHDEKISNVETRIGAQTTSMLYEMKSELEKKISDIRDSSNKHTVTIIVSIVVAFIIAFLAFYFSALSSIESNVKSSISDGLNKLDSQIIELRKKVEMNQRAQENKPSQSVIGESKKSDGLTKQIQPTPKSSAPGL